MVTCEQSTAEILEELAGQAVRALAARCQTPVGVTD
jgi:hypothetical protein